MKLSDLGFDFGSKLEKPDVNDDLRKLAEALTSVDGDITDRQHTLPPIEDWVKDPYYIGDWALPHERGGLYPALRQSVIDAWKPHITEIILAGSAGSGKCLSGDTLVPDPASGRLIPIRECAGVTHVNAFDAATGKIQTHAVSEFIPSGVKPVVKLTTRNGREVVTTPQHKYLTGTGWKPVYEIEPGELIAVPGKVTVEGKADTDPKLLELLGALATSVRIGNSKVHWNLNTAEVKCVVLARLKEFLGRNDEADATGDTGSASYDSHSHANLSDVESAIAKLGVDLSVLVTERAPDLAFTSNNKAVAGFIRGVFLGNATVDTQTRSVSVTSASKRFIEDIRHLSLRLGMNGVVSSRIFTQNKKVCLVWDYTLSGADDLTRLMKDVGLYGHRAAMLGTLLVCPDEDAADELSPWSTPKSFWEIVQDERRKTGISWGALAKRCGELGTISETRASTAFSHQSKDVRLPLTVARAITDAFDSENMRLVTYSDVRWDTVESVTPCGDVDVYDLTVPGPANFVAADIICHNSNRACILLLRLLQELLCYKNPGKALGLSAASTLVIAFASVSKQKSREVGFDRFATMVKQSQFIMENFPPNPKFSGKLVFDDKKIACKPVVSGERGILSEDLIGLLIDEAAFMDVTEKSKKARGETQVYDSASNMYHQANARMKTRFHDTRRQMPGKVIIASSAQFPDDFVSRRRVEVEQTLDKSVYVSDLAVWQAKPPGTYSNHTFRVEIADENRFSRILKDDDEPRPGARIIDVPIDLRREFEGDLDRAIRDLAGVPLLTLAPFITNREAVRSCIRTVDKGHELERCVHPFANSEGDVAETTTLQDGCDFVWEYLCKQDKNGAWVPRTGTDKFRVIHFDPSFVNDATGFAVGHPTSVKTVLETDPLTGELRSKQKVGVDIDVMLRVVCPEGPGSEISWPALEQLVVRLQDHGFDIALVSSDSPAGRVFVQRFRELGFYAETASVDKTPEPYLTLKKLINEGLISYYEYDPFIQELFRLEWNKRRNKIDHPRSSVGGVRPSKDVADAVAMVAYHIATRHDEFDTSGPAVSFGAI